MGVTKSSKTAGDIKLVSRLVADLIPFARNSRTHSDEQVAQIAASIKEFGFTNPILTDGDNGIIAGHGRLQAARKLGLTEVPTIPLTGLTEAQKRAYVIADNKLALNAGWDMELLSSEIAGLGEEGFDLSLLGFNENELAALLAEKTEGLTDPDEIPNPPEIPVSSPGDVWLLGRHRIVCGDSTDADTVAKCLNGVVPHLMVTDPPYGVEYDAATQLGRQAWAKSQLVMSRGHYHPQHESCWYAARGTANWAGDRKQTTLWQIDKPQKSETGHSTQKPVECMKRPIENNSSPGQAVYEPFSGSGTTIIAGEMTGRSIHAIELNPAYVDVAIKRWQDFTGQQAVHAETGETFDDMAAKRVAEPA